jgi:integrase
MLVWLAMVTGSRRGELCGLRWREVYLGGGVLTFRQSQGKLAGRQWQRSVGVDTKTSGGRGCLSSSTPPGRSSPSRTVRSCRHTISTNVSGQYS